jgi:hypothetical protein
VRSSESLAVALVIHPVVQTAFASLGLSRSTYRPQASDVHNARARAAGFQAGKEFSPSPTRRVAPATPRLKQG